jgi:hypothetical protein
MGKRLFCDNCGHNETKENPVHAMTFFLASVDPSTALTSMRVGQPLPSRPKSSKDTKVEVGGKKLEDVRDVPTVENWKEIEYDGPSAEVLFVGNQELCQTCVKSIVSDMASKFKHIQDHGTSSECINTEEKKPNTIVVLPDGSNTTIEEITKHKAAAEELAASGKLPPGFSDREKTEEGVKEIEEEAKAKKTKKEEA